MYIEDNHRARARRNRLSNAPSARPEAMPHPDESADSLAALRSFVSPENLSVVLQPIVDLSTGETFAHEALVRCDLEAYRNPLDLFDKAVARRCTGRLGRMIREIGVPLCNGPLFINVHPDELKESWLVRPDDPIYEHDHDVFIEITESVPLSHREVCRNVLAEIGARAGVHLVVDDLGAGYSNLMRIADLEPTMVKLDRQLVQGLQHSKRQRQLVAGVVELCNKLGAEVIAEGVETEEEFDAVRLTGVQYAQGYLFAKPAFPPKRVTWPPHRIPDEPIASAPTRRGSRKTKNTAPKIPTAPSAPYELDVNVGHVVVDGAVAALRRGKPRDTVPRMAKEEPEATTSSRPVVKPMVAEARERARTMPSRTSSCSPTVPKMKRPQPTPQRRASTPDESSIRAMRKALGTLPDELLVEQIEVGRDGAYSATTPKSRKSPSTGATPRKEQRRIASTLRVKDADELARRLDAQSHDWEDTQAIRDKTTVPQMRKATPSDEDDTTSGIRSREPGVSPEVSRHLAKRVPWGSKEPPKAVSWD